MRFEWNDAKARENHAKHGITFDFARRAWDDPLREITYDREEFGEARFHCIGVVGAATLVVVHCYPDGDETRIRLISARRATRRERAGYERAL